MSTTGVNPLLKPRARRISYASVGLAILLGGGLLGGIWYVYTAQQARPVGTSPPGTATPTAPQGVGISTEKIKYDPSKAAPVEQNGTPPEDAGLVDRLTRRVGELEADAAAKAAAGAAKVVQTVAAPLTKASPSASTPSKPPNPAIALKAKALADSRRAPLVVIRTAAKDEDVTQGVRTLQPGWKIPFLVETAINSDIGGEFVARVSETVYASGAYEIPLIPSGATVMGSTAAAKLIPGNERLPMMGVMLSIPHMKPIELGSLPVMDEQGQLGMVDEIHHHYARMAAMVLLRGAVNGATRMVQSEARQLGPLGEIGAGVAQGTNQAANQQIQTYDVRPSIKVMKGSRGYVLITKPLTIPRLPSQEP